MENFRISWPNLPTKEKPIHAILVHGTWGSDSAWIQPNSNFRNVALRSVEMENVHIFKWSGKNNHDQRHKASENLKSLIKTIDSPNIFVVSHSHGGNIALNSVDKNNQSKFICLINIATPYIHIKERVNEVSNAIFGSIIIVLFLAGISLFNTYHDSFFDAWSIVSEKIQKLNQGELQLILDKNGINETLSEIVILFFGYFSIFLLILSAFSIFTGGSFPIIAILFWYYEIDIHNGKDDISITRKSKIIKEWKGELDIEMTVHSIYMKKDEAHDYTKILSILTNFLTNIFYGMTSLFLFLLVTGLPVLLFDEILETKITEYIYGNYVFDNIYLFLLNFIPISLVSMVSIFIFRWTIFGFGGEKLIDNIIFDISTNHRAPSKVKNERLKEIEDCPSRRGKRHSYIYDSNSTMEYIHNVISKGRNK